MNLYLTLEIIQMGTDRPQDFTGISILTNESHSVWQYNPLTHQMWIDTRCRCTPDVDAPQMWMPTRCFQSSTFKHLYPNPVFLSSAL